MNNEHILTSINQNTTAGAPLDFAGLMARIEADGGKSTAAQMTAKRASAGKVIGTAAGIVLGTGLSAAAFIAVVAGTSMGMASEAECAPEAVYDSDMEYSVSVEEEAVEEEYMDSTVESNIADSTTGQMAGVASDGDVSDSDVSDSDVSGSDTGGDE